MSPFRNPPAPVPPATVLQANRSCSLLEAGNAFRSSPSPLSTQPLLARNFNRQRAAARHGENQSVQVISPSQRCTCRQLASCDSGRRRCVVALSSCCHHLPLVRYLIHRRILTGTHASVNTGTRTYLSVPAHGLIYCSATQQETRREVQQRF